MRLHPKIPLIAFARLVHLRIPLPRPPEEDNAIPRYAITVADIRSYYACRSPGLSIYAVTCSG